MPDTLDDAIQFRLQVYKARSQDRGREFKLSYQQFKTLLFSPCHYCGRPADQGNLFRRNTQSFRCHGIDRVDNAKGYTPENSVACCIWCNASKSVLGASDWLQQIKRIYEHSKGRPEMQEERELSTEPFDRLAGLQHARVAARTSFRARRRKNA